MWKTFSKKMICIHVFGCGFENDSILLFGLHGKSLIFHPSMVMAV
jgi:hypothetical protein